MKYFDTCASIEEAKKLYRELLKKHHPDHAGKESEAATVEIISQFNAFCDGFMSHSFHAYYEDKEHKPSDETITHFRKS